MSLESYLDRGSVRYAARWERRSGPAYRAYHGWTKDRHQAEFNRLKGQGYVPVAISVISNGGLKYTALYEKKNIGAWEARSVLTPAQYQAKFNENIARGRQPIYLNSFVHGGKPYISAIFSSSAQGSMKARHGLTGSGYQSEWTSARRSRMLTRSVTGYQVGSSARFAAVWRR